MKKNKIIKNIESEFLNFKYLNVIYKNDKELVLLAVKKDGDSLQYASDELKNDKEIVLTAINHNPFAFGICFRTIEK